MADYGIKVSRDGEDVNTIPNSAANIKKFALLSGVNLLKIKTSAKVTLNNGASTTIAHGLAYKPLYWVYRKTGSNLYPLYYDTSGTFAYIDATNLVIGNYDGSQRDFYYFIFYDPV